MKTPALTIAAMLLASTAHAVVPTDPVAQDAVAAPSEAILVAENDTSSEGSGAPEIIVPGEEGGSDDSSGDDGSSEGGSDEGGSEGQGGGEGGEGHGGGEGGEGHGGGEGGESSGGGEGGGSEGASE